MPIYVYKCNDCEHVFEARQRFTDKPLTSCPECSDGEVRRVINSVGIVFKGSGFYVTDSRNGKNGTLTSDGSTSKGTTSETKAETSDSSKTEKKSTETEKS